MEATALALDGAPQQIDLEDIAAACKCSMRTLRRFIQHGQLQARRLPGRRTVVDLCEIERAFGPQIATAAAMTAMSRV